MTQSVTIECDRCGERTTDDGRGWARMEVRSEGWIAEYDLCPPCRKPVLDEATGNGKATE